MAFWHGGHRSLRGIHTIVTCAALLLFAWLTLRHVGESVFLEDQVDQLQNFESLVRLRPEGLWGAIMSGTVPPARALGPLGAVVFGVPVALGLGIDGIHITTSLLIALGTAVCFITLAGIDVAFAWLWLLVFSATGLVWWNAGMLWSNTVLLPCGLAVAALAASCLQRPSRVTLGWLVVAGLFALQLHLVAVVAVPVIAIVASVTFREARRVSTRTQVWMIAAAVVVALGPYLLAEGMTGFRNTRAILGHLGGSGSADTGSATMALTIALDPTGLLRSLGLSFIPLIGVGAALSTAAVWLVARSDRVLYWMTACAIAAIAGQGLFFWWMSRPFAGYHHVTLLAPFYAVVPAVLLRRALFTPPISMQAACGVGAAVLALLVLAGSSMADRNLERTPWSYARIRATVDALCGDAAVQTDEGPGFAALLNPQYDSVLRYMMRRGLTTCRYQPSSDVMIAARRDGDYPASKAIGQSMYLRELVLPPGIARYRRAP